MASQEQKRGDFRTSVYTVKGFMVVGSSKEAPMTIEGQTEVKRPVCRKATGRKTRINRGGNAGVSNKNHAHMDSITNPQIIPPQAISGRSMYFDLTL